MNIIWETLTENCAMETNRLIELNWPCLKSSICVYTQRETQTHSHTHTQSENWMQKACSLYIFSKNDKKVLQNGVILLLSLLSVSFFAEVISW